MSPDFAHVLSKAASVVFAAGGIIIVTRQVRKPAWFIGRFVVRTMNRSHAGLRSWGLGKVTVPSGATVLDVGCGGGATIAVLAESNPGSKVHGVDFSDASVAVARKTNARLIREGRVNVREAGVSALPYDSNNFDLVTAFETHFYWPNLPSDVKEIQRVLKPGGQVAIVAEVYRGRSMAWLYGPAMGLLRAKYLTVDEHRALLANAGFVDVSVITEKARGWICALGRKAPA
ncbi:MAG TPA: class I SAM-dependent methyltransferase [Gemmatimonadaceae bacterium]